MDKLTDVSETAFITLISRALETGRANPVIHDPMAVKLLETIKSHLPPETRKKMFERKWSSTLTRHIALRARKYDQYTRNFIDAEPQALVVSLGSGFDTRYWRVSNQPWRYIEIDLPEVVREKQLLLDTEIEYRILGCSVLDENWIEEISQIQTKQILFLAEGLFMYLPREGVIDIFRGLSKTFTDSEIAFEVVNALYTQGIWKKMVESKMRNSAASEAGSSYQYGVKDAREIESYGDGIKVIEEWSYFEDPDIRPAFLKWFRHIKMMSRTQWTIRAAIG
jgi:methyltransferase (TIGR00027 family)